MFSPDIPAECTNLIRSKSVPRRIYCVEFDKDAGRKPDLRYTIYQALTSGFSMDITLGRGMTRPHYRHSSRLISISSVFLSKKMNNKCSFFIKIEIRRRKEETQPAMASVVAPVYGLNKKIITNKQQKEVIYCGTHLITMIIRCRKIVSAVATPSTLWH